MQNNRYLSRMIIFLILFAISGICNIYAQQYGNFPFQASFLNNRLPPGVKFPGSPNSATLEDNGLQLTSASERQFGAIYLNDQKFKSELGIFIEFEYMVYEGSGGDGFCVFFFDANTPDDDMYIGAPGAGLGYTYNRAPFDGFSQYRMPGLNGAYLGIGFDSYGNFGGMRWQGESRVQGIPYSFFSPKSGSAPNGFKSNNAVVLRGGKRTTPVTYSGGTPVPGMTVGYVGYPVLVSQRTVVDSGFVLSTTASDPKYLAYNQLIAKQPFTIRGGSQFERPTDPGYRKAYIEMYPNGETGTSQGFLISVMIENEHSRDTIIYDYNYKVQTYYYENAYNNTKGDNDSGYGFDGFEITPKLLSIALPLELKIGFAAATGEGAARRTDRHVIKNVGIRLPRSAVAHDDFVDDRYQGSGDVIFEPLLNDLAYNGVVSRVQTPKPDNLDPTTFKFVDKDGNVPANPHVLVVANEGTWRYTSDGNNYASARVTFTPEPSFLDQARVRYIIKGKNDGIGPYHDDAFYSVPAVIGVDIALNPNPSRNIISNKMVTPALR